MVYSSFHPSYAFVVPTKIARKSWFYCNKYCTNEQTIHNSSAPIPNNISNEAGARNIVSLISDRLLTI